MSYYKSNINRAWRRHVINIRDCTYEDPYRMPSVNWCCKDSKCKYKNKNCHIHTNCGRKSCECCIRTKCEDCGYNADSVHPVPIYDEDSKIFNNCLVRLMKDGYLFSYNIHGKFYYIENKNGFHTNDPNEKECVIKAYLKVYYDVDVLEKGAD